MPVLDYVQASMVLKDQYETVYGIFNHFNNPNKPLSSIGMFSSEANGYNSQLYGLFRKYKEAKIKDHFGLTLNEFIAQPREQIEWLFQLAEEFSKEEYKRNQQVLQELKVDPKK